MDDVAMQQKDPENRTDQKKAPHSVTKEQMANHHNVSDDPASDGNCDDQGNIDSKMIDLNMRPVRTHGQGSNSQVHHILHVNAMGSSIITFTDHSHFPLWSMLFPY